MQLISKAILLVTLLITLQAEAQNRFFTKNGMVEFDATSKNSPEKITARNEKATSVLDRESGAIQFAVLMKAFIFEKALMQEHFNENYIESTKFPKSEFKGTVVSISSLDMNNEGNQKVIVKGNFTLHGITREIEVPGILIIKNGQISGGKAEFQINLSDYNISIPSLVSDKVSRTATIKVIFDYEPLKSS